MIFFSAQVPNSQRLSTASSQLPSILTSESTTTETSIRPSPNIHSRQASSSSCTSSVGNLGSPKPEKRQANSPLPPPPTPKSSLQSQNSSTSNLTSSTQSGRSSVASVIEVKTQSRENLHMDGKNAIKKPSVVDENVAKKKSSPSKDLEGMYAKVMKKNKLSNLPSQNSSPILPRKISEENGGGTISYGSSHDLSEDNPMSNSIHASPEKSSVISANVNLDNNYETIDKKRRARLDYNQKDPGYETIPGDKNENNNEDGVKIRSSVISE